MVIGKPLAIALVAVGASCKGDSPGVDLTGVDRSSGAIPTTAVPRIAAPTIDGDLGDVGWATAGRTGPLVSPMDGKPVPRSRVNGEARFGWDARALYVAATIYDRDPGSPFGRDELDPHIWSKASGIELMIQPGERDDNRNYYEIQVDVNGAVWDTRFDDYNRPITGAGDERRYGHQEWSASLERAVKVEPGVGYHVEMAVPWTALGDVPAAGQAWRVNVYAFRDGQRDALAWSPVLGQGNFHRASRFGRLVFAAEGGAR